MWQFNCNVCINIYIPPSFCSWHNYGIYKINRIINRTLGKIQRQNYNYSYRWLHFLNWPLLKVLLLGGHHFLMTPGSPLCPALLLQDLDDKTIITDAAYKNAYLYQWRPSRLLVATGCRPYKMLFCQVKVRSLDQGSTKWTTLYLPRSLSLGLKLNVLSSQPRRNRTIVLQSEHD